MSESTNLVEVARTVGAYGVRGSVRVRALGTGEALCGTRAWYFCERGGKARALTVLGVKPHGDHFIAQIEGIDSKEAADSLKGLILIAREDFPPLPEKEHWVVDLVGSTVINRHGETLGCVLAVLNNGAQDYLDVKNEETHRRYSIPFVKTYIDRVREGEKVIDVDWEADWV